MELLSRLASCPRVRSRSREPAANSSEESLRSRETIYRKYRWTWKRRIKSAWGRIFERKLWISWWSAYTRIDKSERRKKNLPNIGRKRNKIDTEFMCVLQPKIKIQKKIFLRCTFSFVLPYSAENIQTILFTFVSTLRTRFHNGLQFLIISQLDDIVEK